MLPSVIRQVGRSVGAALLLAGIFAGLSLQAENARVVRGRVLDPMGDPIPGATVAALTVTGEAASSVSTSQTGEFTLPLAPGLYTVTVSSQGFAQFRKPVDFQQGSVNLGDIVLQIGQVNDTITVVESLGYHLEASRSAMKTATPLRDTPQAVSVVSRELIRDQLMSSMAEVVRYVPGVTMAQGEGHRDAPVIRGNASTADFFVNGVRDDVQYFRDVYNLERVEVLKGPNAMIFGRGGGGGVINRVTREAGFNPIREVVLQGGSYRNRRISGDFNEPLNNWAGVRLNAMYENSDSFRQFANVERYGFNPSLLISPGSKTRILFNYEYFNDGRIVDRGVPSFNGRPITPDRSTFFGDPRESFSDAGVHFGSASVDHQAGRWNIRNLTTVADYDKYYQNVLPGAVNASLTQVALSGYNNGTLRRNVFNQTDIGAVFQTGGIRHTLVFGSEFGRQNTDNLRLTGYFNNSATSIQVPFQSPTVFTPITFRASAGDADNHVRATVAAGFVQDQIELHRRVQVVAGVRYDSFNLDFRNQRNNEILDRRDNLISPRFGLVLKPADTLSVYSSYSVSYLPSSGDQFASLDATTQTLRPEKFNNYEAGIKWDIRRYLTLTSAVYRLDRENTRSRDPNDPTRIVQTGSQRSNGYELSLNGSVSRKWTVAAGYSYQDAFISSATTAAITGARVALVPSHSLSVWNNYQLLPRLGLGLGLIHQESMFAAFDNKVTLPGFTRADMAAFYSLNEYLRIQANIENMFDRTYFPTAHNNNNISPGFPRAVRIGIVARF